jgi:hypothetical protein
MIKRLSFAPPALHMRRQFSSQTLGLILPLYLMMLPDALKCIGKRASCTVSPNAFGPGPSRLRLHPS